MGGELPASVAEEKEGGDEFAKDNAKKLSCSSPEVVVCSWRVECLSRSQITKLVLT